jgi:ATP-dependent Zn protease
MQQFDWVGMLINWFPMILIFGVWFWFVRGMQGCGGYYKTLLTIQKDNLESTRRMAEALERLAAALEKRAP